MRAWTRGWISVWIIALAAVALGHLPWAWSLAERMIAAPGTGARARWLGVVFTPQTPAVLLLIVMLAAAAGSAATMALAFTERAGHGTLEQRWAPWYLLRPLTAIALGVLTYALVKAGLLGPTDTTSSDLLLAVAAGGAAGLFTDQVLLKVRGALGLSTFLKKTADQDRAAPARPDGGAPAGDGERLRVRATR